MARTKSINVVNGHADLSKAERFIVAKCAARFEHPETYKVKGETRKSHVVLCRELGAALQVIDAKYADQKVRIALYDSMASRGLVKKGWAGKLGPSLCDLRHDTGGSASGSISAEDRLILAALNK